MRSLSVFTIAATFALGGFFAINSANAVISSITVTGPTVGQHLNDGVNITWTAVGASGDLVDIYYSDNDFSTSTKLTTSGLAYDAGSYNWDTVAAGIPDDTDYKIKIQSTTNAVEGISAAFRIDNTMPTITLVTTYDSNTNGTVDKATIVFSEPVDDSDFEADDFTIDGQAGATIESTNDGSTVDDNTFDVTFTTVVGTGEKSITYTAGGGTDIATPGNALATVTVIADDQADPVFLSAETKTTTTIEAIFSEDLLGSTVTGADFTVTGHTVDDADEEPNDSGIVVITLSTTMDTDETPTVNYVGSIKDLNDNTASNDSVVATDGTAPMLSAVHIQSNNTNTAFAKVGDTVAVSFTSSETIGTPTVTIAGHPSVAPTNPSGNNWEATYVMVSGDTEGLVAFSIAFSDTLGNPGVADTTVDDASSVTFDKTNPLVAITTPAVDSVTTVNNVTGVFVVTDTNAVTCAYTVTVDHVVSAAIDCAGASITALTDGRRELALTATDAAGNFTTTNASFVINLDDNLTVGAAGKDFTTIQAAVNGATTGDDITIDTGAYPEAVTIASKDLDLIGSGGAVTATSFTLTSTTVSGSTDVTAPTVQVNAGAKIADGVLLSSSVLNIGSGTFTDNFTVDKDLTVTCGVGGGTTTQTKGIVITANGVTVNNCTFSGDIGGDAFINLDSDTAHSGISLTNNTFSGAISTWHLIRAGASKTDLAITGNTFTGSTAGNSNGLILLGAGGDNINVSDNAFSDFPDNYSFFVIIHNASGGARTTNLTINNNSIDFTGYTDTNDDGAEGISVRYADNVHINGNTLTGSAAASTYETGITLASVISTVESTVNDNIISGFSQDMRMLRWSDEGFTDGVTITGNTLTNGVITDAGVSRGTGLYLAGTNLVIQNNEFSGNANQGIYIPLTDPVGTNNITGTVISYNKIFGNTSYGVRSLLSSSTASASPNWWGDATGPLHDDTNLLGAGDEVTDFVDYSPWCITDDMGDCEGGGNEFLGSSDPIDHFDIDPSAGSAIVNVLITLTVTAKDSADITRVNDTSVVSMAADHGASLGTLLLTLISGTRDTTVTNSVTGTVNVSGIKVGGSATGSTSVSFTSSDPDAPTIISHSPADNATDIAVTTVPYITFSEALKASTVNSTNIQLKKYSDDSTVAASISLVEGGTRVNITPNSSLANSTQYYFAVSTAVQDEVGNALAVALNAGSKASHEFTTVADTADHVAPTITSHFPLDNATSISVNVAPYIIFSEALKATTINSTNIQLKKYSDDSTVAATISLVEGGTRVIITPASALDTSIQYYFAVSTSVQDEAGNALASALDDTTKTTHEFTTAADTADHTAPVIASHTPADNATDIAVTTVPYITFSEALKASTINSTNIQLKKYSDNSNVSATVSLVEGGTRVNITPDSSLANNTQYYFAVSTSVQDEAGNALVTALDVGSRDSHEFTTVAIEPVVVDEIVAESSTATADDTYINGWHYIYRITVNTDETELSVKFTDWDNADTTDTIAANDNMRVLFNSVTANGLGAVVGLTDSDIEDGFGDVDSYAIGNDYTDQTPDVIDISGLDTGNVRDGRQVQFDVYTKLPVTTVPGFYTTTYGIQVN